MAGQDDVLHQTLRALHAHLHPEWGDRTGLDVFGRLLAKHVKPADWTANTHLDVREVHIASCAEEWSIDALAQIPRAHGGLLWFESLEPIIIADFEGQLRLLDGNHRINTWAARRQAGSYLVHIHVVSGDVRFVERQAVQGGA